MLNIPYREYISVEVADDTARDIYFLFGVRKSGSSILNNIVHALADMNDIHYVDVAGRLFQSGIPVSRWQSDPELRVLLRPGNLYGGFRNCPIGLVNDPLVQASRKLLLVRDPRDALVSEYYSNAYSHSIPAGGQAREDMLKLREQALGTGLEAYVLKRARALQKTLREYALLESGPTLQVVRYEDIITDKRSLIHGVCRFYAWTVTASQVDQIMGWADVIPDEERPTEFVRRVVPGDHVQKLSPSTIASLNSIFEVEMQHYGYR